jgi:hypothetical protein
MCVRTDVSKHWGEGTWISREFSGALEQMEKCLKRTNERASGITPETLRKGQRESADERETCQRTN